ncbi:MAG TPA: glutamine synthetase family protein [Streptomyces sp.]
MTTAMVDDEAEVTPSPVHASAEERQAEQHLPYAALRTLIEAGEIDTVLFAVPNCQGELKGKRFEAGLFLKRIARRSSEMCAYVLATDVNMSPADGFGLTSWEQGYQDLSVWPDLKSTRLVPWRERTVVVFGDAVTHDGVRVEVAPREILRRQLNRLAELGLYPMTGIETEFSLYQGTDTAAAEAGGQGLRPLVAGNLDYSLDHDPVSDRFFSSLQRDLMGAGLPVEAMKSEAGPGQVELTFRYGHAKMACERHLLFKHAVRALAAREGLTPTFMAAPETGLANGLHIHISLWSGAASALGDSDGRLTETGRHAIAGLLAGLPQLAPLYAPNTNSYKRFHRGSFAPTAFTWGYDNRTCAVRVVGGDQARLRLEVRVAGADANAYLAVASVLASITHGIERQLQPGPAFRGNAYDARDDVPLMPSTLYDALADFKESDLAHDMFGPAVVEHIVRLTELELDHERREVTDTERRRWLTRA